MRDKFSFLVSFTPASFIDNEGRRGVLAHPSARQIKIWGFTFFEGML